MATQGVRAGLANPDRRIAAAINAAGETMVKDVPKALRTAGGVAAVAFRGALFPDDAVEDAEGEEVPRRRRKKSARFWYCLVSV